jgi:helicase
VDQLLAILSCFQSIPRNQLEQAYARLLSRTVPFEEGVRFLKQHALASQAGQDLMPTELGRAAAVSYFSASNVAAIQEHRSDAAQELSVRFEPLDNVYLSPRLQAEIERAFRTKFATRLFAGAILNLMSTQYNRRTKRLPRWILQTFSKWTLTFFNCKCKESPFCDHGQWNLSRTILSMRFRGMTPSQISTAFLREYDLFIFPGDIFDFLDNQVHILQGIQRVAETLERFELADSATKAIAAIEHPLKDGATSRT